MPHKYCLELDFVISTSVGTRDLRNKGVWHRKRGLRISGHLLQKTPTECIGVGGYD